MTYNNGFDWKFQRTTLKIPRKVKKDMNGGDKEDIDFCGFLRAGFRLEHSLLHDVANRE